MDVASGVVHTLTGTAANEADIPGATEPVYAPYVEHLPPDVGAAKVWLYNRRPDLWRDKREVEVSGTLEHRIAAMTREERQARLLELQAKMNTIEGEAVEVQSKD